MPRMPSATTRPQPLLRYGNEQLALAVSAASRVEVASVDLDQALKSPTHGKRPFLANSFF
jgi:hypothetical protein